ncbi:hypothetical protein CBM2634_A240051 [Cupriavidus taiwanensis]|uniref:Uncharacterized protein n=1 Tax=Cupriavidus taiwanensis TaxID=164546 RepID=A0A375J0G1_9BURK|nr:hypothetical protein CBM2634_A240051 [Cupriavidus taiwanensis]
MTSRAACARRQRKALSRVLALSEKPHGQRLCGRCTNARSTRVELCGGTLRHARDARHRRAPCMLYTLDPVRTRDAVLDARRHRRRSRRDTIAERARE